MEEDLGKHNKNLHQQKLHFLHQIYLVYCTHKLKKNEIEVSLKYGIALTF